MTVNEYQEKNSINDAEILKMLCKQDETVKKTIKDMKTIWSMPDFAIVKAYQDHEIKENA